MSDLRTAAQQALEALELGHDSAKAEADQFHAAMAGYKPHHHAAMDADVQKIAQAIIAIKVALEQPEPEQEPKSTWQKLYEAAIDQRNEAVAELRRLHAENVLLHERHHFDNGVLAELLEALKRLHDATWLVSKGHYNEELHDIAVSKARAVIAKAERQV